MSIGERLRSLRKKAGLTQKELGEKLGVSASMIGQYETDLRNPKIDTIIKIANALGADTSEILDFSPINPELNSLVALYDILRKPSEKDGTIRFSHEERAEIKRLAESLNVFSAEIESSSAFSTMVHDMYFGLFDKLNFNGKCLAVEIINEIANDPSYQSKK